MFLFSHLPVRVALSAFQLFCPSLSLGPPVTRCPRCRLHCYIQLLSSDPGQSPLNSTCIANAMPRLSKQDAGYVEVDLEHGRVAEGKSTWQRVVHPRECLLERYVPGRITCCLSFSMLCYAILHRVSHSPFKQRELHEL
ncbi:hypothetical protein C8Q76DRAFT_418785 [Earliella scabrosa]|nr:hypothetical protein C8Q76DRAFT_418785 [Earliella scabrosa]